MKNLNRRISRVLAMALVVVMVMAMVPSVFADGLKEAPESFQIVDRGNAWITMDFTEDDVQWLSAITSITISYTDEYGDYYENVKCVPISDAYNRSDNYFSKGDEYYLFYGDDYDDPIWAISVRDYTAGYLYSLHIGPVGEITHLVIESDGYEDFE